MARPARRATRMVRTPLPLTFALEQFARNDTGVVVTDANLAFQRRATAYKYAI